MMMRKYPVPTKEEAEELRRLRQEAGMTIPQMAEAFHTQKSRISDYENGKRGSDPDLIEKLKKRYKLIIQYNA
jgi:transcriptional regulator with XRE-family HTH domain